MRIDRKAATVIGSDKARALQKTVWKEIIDELKANVADLQDGLEISPPSVHYVPRDGCDMDYCHWSGDGWGNHKK